MISPYSGASWPGFIFIGLTVQFLCLIAAPFIDPGDYFWAYVAIAFTMQLGMALYDTCTDGLTLAIIMVIFFGIAYGAYQTEYFAVAMRFVDPRIAASMYAILMAFTNIGQGIGMYLSGALTDQAGFSRTFLILLGINLLILPLLPLVFRQKKQVSKIT